MIHPLWFDTEHGAFTASIEGDQWVIDLAGVELPGPTVIPNELEPATAARLKEWLDSGHGRHITDFE
ncbi:MAG: hypothetical protein HOP28_12235 [Gemmatimonadales bacterium]|nr:hypothetical protein [Gemmatimonadales bacterium]